MAGPHTTRARARVAMLDEIKQRALEQLARDGAAALSLREIARELGVVSSALYRYFDSRDALLTALIVDGYAELGIAVAAADGAQPITRYRRRWAHAAGALRSWALTAPSRFQLLYGSPVPGYRAPADTIAPAADVVTALLRPVVAAAGGPGLVAGPELRTAGLRRQLMAVADGLELGLSPATMARATRAFAELVGLIELELGGHFVGGFEPADQLYDEAVRQLAGELGLPAERTHREV